METDGGHGSQSDSSETPDDCGSDKRPNPIMKHFAYEHLPLHLQDVSKHFGLLANLMSKNLPDGPEKSAGLRKLLEAKDCFVRAKLG